MNNEKRSQGWVSYLMSGFASKTIVVGLLVWGVIRIIRAAYREESVAEVLGTSAIAIGLAGILYLILKIKKNSSA
jgi:hypothetical protein